MSALDRLPALATTGVGSLPFAAPAVAARHAARAYGLPFCPQLPRLDGDMLHEWLGADPGRCGWSADRDRERPAAWDAFVAELAAQPPEHRLAKLQVTGPITLAAALERSAGHLGCGFAAVSLAREVSAWLAANTAGQVRRLRELDLDVLLVVDEPGLAQAGLTARAADVWDPLRTVACAFGLHVCGAVPWRLVDELAPDLVSFDVARYGLDDGARGALAGVVRRGGRVAWGALDPVRPDGTTATAGRATAAILALTDRHLAAETVAGRSLLTPACGTGRLSCARERLIAATLTTAADATAAAVAIHAALRRDGDDDLAARVPVEQVADRRGDLA